MGRRPEKYLRTRKKLQWFFEQLASMNIHTLPFDLDQKRTDPRRRQWHAVARKLEVARMLHALESMATPSGLIIEGRSIRLTKWMLDHLVAEFTAKATAVDDIYGRQDDPIASRRKADLYHQTLKVALARVDAAFVGMHILPRGCDDHAGFATM